MVLSKALRFFYFLCCIGMPCSVGFAADSNLAALKTAFVFNFIKFIDWPASETEDLKFDLCLYGVTDELKKNLLLLNGKTVSRQQISVKMIFGDPMAEHCEMVFIDASIDAKGVVELLKSKPVVTVSDQPNFVEGRGMLELVERENRLNYKINLDAARFSGLHIKASLLKLAQKVIATP